MFASLIISVGFRCLLSVFYIIVFDLLHLKLTTSRHDLRPAWEECCGHRRCAAMETNSNVHSKNHDIPVHCQPVIYKHSDDSDAWIGMMYFHNAAPEFSYTIASKASFGTCPRWKISLPREGRYWRRCIFPGACFASTKTHKVGAAESKLFDPWKQLETALHFFFRCQSPFLN